MWGDPELLVDPDPPVGLEPESLASDNGPLGGHLVSPPIGVDKRGVQGNTGGSDTGRTQGTPEGRGGLRARPGAPSGVPWAPHGFPCIPLDPPAGIYF